MKSVFKYLCVLVVLLSYGCNNDDTIACFSPPSVFAFELVDKTSGENLFTNGTYNSKDISITDLDNPNKTIQYNFITENNYNVITLGNIGWNTETINYSIKVAGKSIFEFHVQANRKSGKCSHTEYQDLQIKNTAYQLDQTKGVYKILIDSPK
ncbi:hypothetical protein [Flavobacterium sp.]|uniref:hypothetical protein n=1 Tax=Flavobacterium sp. TaxID=239 RepID=UPI0031CE5F2F